MDKNTKLNNWDRYSLHCCTVAIHDKKGWQQGSARIQVQCLLSNQEATGLVHGYERDEGVSWVDGC